MAPISSIMGQIMIAGMYRQPGPTGGELAPVGTSGLLAEKVTRPGDEQPAIKVWKPRDRNRPSTWEPVTVDRAGWVSTASGAGGEQKASVGVAGRTYAVVFPTEEQQQLALRTLADWVVRPRLLKTAGIAQVVTMGGGR